MKKAHTIILPFSNVTTVIKFKSYGSIDVVDIPRKYGTYHHAEAGDLGYIKWLEENAPAMPEHLWKKREQLTIAAKRVFDAIIELPPMDKREAVSKISEHIGLSKGTVNWHRNTIMAVLDEEELREAA